MGGTSLPRVELCRDSKGFYLDPTRVFDPC